MASVTEAKKIYRNVECSCDAMRRNPVIINPLREVMLCSPYNYLGGEREQLKQNTILKVSLPYRQSQALCYLSPLLADCSNGCRVAVAVSTAKSSGVTGSGLTIIKKRYRYGQSVK